MQGNHQVLKRTEAELTVQPASMFSPARAHNEGKDVTIATAVGSLWGACGDGLSPTTVSTSRFPLSSREWVGKELTQE